MTCWKKSTRFVYIPAKNTKSVSGQKPEKICAVTGLAETYPGQGLGEEAETLPPLLEPVLTCQVCLPEGCDPALMLPKLKLLEEEQPELHIVWDEQLQEIQAQIMGEIQTEILQSVIAERFGIDVTFGKIPYCIQRNDCKYGGGRRTF